MRPRAAVVGLLLCAGACTAPKLDVTLPAATSADAVTHYMIVRDYADRDADLSISIAAPTHDPAAWRGRSIYFVVTDRFANGDPGAGTSARSIRTSAIWPS